MYTGEIISLTVTISWTATAIFSEIASKRMGSLPLNVVRMTLSLLMLSATLWLTMGVPYPPFTDSGTWIWLSLSGLVGYVFCDYCLFQGYILMNSRYGQLLMTLSSPAAAVSAWVLLGERMHTLSIIGMLVTMTGIGISVLSKGGENHRLSLKLPLKGVLFGTAAGIGQGVGLVLSKLGMQHYEASISASGIMDMASYYAPDALLHVSLATIMPFASTMIRAIIGLFGFSIALFLFTRHGANRFRGAVSDRHAMLFALGATIFGPFIGVSLSLMATLYTNAGIAQTIMAMTPVMIILPSWLFMHQKVTFLEVLGACISVVGVALFFI